jgi:hypothetical protein
MGFCQGSVCVCGLAGVGGVAEPHFPGRSQGSLPLPWAILSLLCLPGQVHLRWGSSSTWVGPPVL